MPLRHIDDYELVWILGGRARLLTASGDVVLDQRRLLLLVPGVEHEFVWDRVQPTVHAFVHFGSEHFSGAMPSDVVVRSFTSDDPLRGLCSYLLWLGRRGVDVTTTPAYETLRLLIDLLVDGPLPESPAELSPTRELAPAIDHLRVTWARRPLRPIRVPELAKAAAVSPGYLRRLFLTEFGHSPGRLLERLRCSRAEDLLIGTNLAAHVIAEQCGFADVSHFCHRFSAITSVSPSEFRRRRDTSSVLDDPSSRRLAALIWAQGSA